MRIGKRFVGTMLCICMLASILCVTTMAAGGTDLILNGDFAQCNAETNAPLRWSGSSGAGSSVIHVKQESDTSLGDYVTLAVESGGGSDPQLLQSRASISITGGMQYRISFDYKTAKSLASQLILVEYNGETRGEQHTVRLESTGDTWQKCVYAFETKSGATNLEVSFKLNRNYAGSTPIDLSVDNVSLFAVEDSREYANGSFELLDVEGVAYGTIGGTVVDTEKFSGTKSLSVAAGQSASMQIASVDIAPRTSATAGEKYVISGYVKGTVGDTAVISLRTDNVGAEALCNKTVACTGDWQYFQFSGYLFSANAVVTVAAGSNVVYMDTLTLKKYSNLLGDGSFESNEIWKVNNAQCDPKEEVADSTVAPTMAHYITSGTDAPDGGKYFHIEAGDKKTYVQSESIKCLDDTKRYILSFWYNCTYREGGSMKLQDEKDKVRVTFDDTKGKWKRGEITFEPSGNSESFKIIIRHDADKVVPDGGYLKVDMLELRELTDAESKVDFYTAATFAGTSASRPNLNHLGHPVDSAKGLDSINAIYVSPTGTTATNDEVVVLAAYVTGANGAKQLVGVAMGDADVPASGDAYPTATLALTDVPDGAELKAFVWDSVSGMKAIKKSASIMK